ncbi:MAG: hypothetical protein K2J15_01080 [Muribaculaceae bacterium]|nr:hypothetical protein [Muribaculaceae bacterium]
MKRYIFKNILTIIFLTMSVSWLSSCGEEPLQPIVDTTTGPMDGYLTVQLTCKEDQATRAVEQGVEDLHENLIETVTLCLWPMGPDHPDTDEPYYFHTFRNLNKQGEVIIRIPLTDARIANLFNVNSDHTCNIFAAVNVEPGEAKTPAALRAMTITSSFAETQEQPSFAMDGTSTAEYASAMNVHSGMAKIELQRSAAKIDLHLNVASEVKETLPNGDERTWIPDLTQMRVTLNNGVKEATLDPDPTDIPDDLYFNTPLDLEYKISEPASEAEHGIQNSEYPYAQEIPFYTYPNEWDSTDPDSPGRSFMTLRIPWSDDGGASYKTCYYRVPVVTPDLDEIVRNTSYHVLLKVSVLGSFVPDEPMPLEDLSYRAAEWGEENFDIEIVEPRYLVVNQNDFDVNNIDSISIPFHTSHKTVVTDIKMVFYRFNYSDAGLKFPVTVTEEMNTRSATASRAGEPVYTYDFDNKTATLKVNHELVIYDAWRGSGSTAKEVSLTNGDGPNLASDSDREKNRYMSVQATLDKLYNSSNDIRWFKKKLVDGKTEPEFSKVEFEVTVQHEDMIGTDYFKETVRINQYPAMFIDAVTNAFKESNNVITGSGELAGAFINKNNVNLGANQSLGGGVVNGYMTSIGLSSSDYLNWNPNLYLITITRLPADTEYILADPRATDVNNMLTDESMQTHNETTWPTKAIGGYNQAQPALAPATDLGEGQTRRLRYYYPTREESAARNLIAPKFRICSSYAGTGAILNRTLARRRGAAYQEKGYPAGRWRLPTFAEVKFIVSLAEEYKIPRLFGTKMDTWKYWCANGTVTIPPKNVTTKATYTFMDAENTHNNDNLRTRFVYDEWYWGGETVDKDTFTWGDEKRN